MRDKLLATGLIGTAVAAVCCFTPALVIVLGALGLSTWMGWLDYLLIPALLSFAALTGYAIVARRTARK
jgi:mercuric ion transport protein